MKDDKTYTQDEALTSLGHMVIAENDIFEHLGGCRIAFLAADFVKQHHGGFKHADCEKVNPKWRALSGFDFVITFYATALDKSPEVQYRIMKHELMHVGFDPGNGDRWLIHHDVEDFRDMIDEYGIDWVRGDA